MNSFDGYGTGCLPHHPDARDYAMEHIPAIANVLAGVLPASVDLAKGWSGTVLNQGPTPACVAYSTAHQQAIYQFLEGENKTYDARRVYDENGGDYKNGVPSDRVLSYAQKTGLPELGADRRNRIESYAFTRSIDTICAALAAKHLVVIAMLLPSDFGNKDGLCGLSAATETDAYHQVCAVGYETGTLRCLNSWGPSFGRGGFFQVRKEYLTKGHNSQGYFYGYTSTDVIDGALKPLPVRAISGYTDEKGKPVTSAAPGAVIKVIGKGLKPVGSVKVTCYIDAQYCEVTTLADDVATVRLPTHLTKTVEAGIVLNGITGPTFTVSAPNVVVTKPTCDALLKRCVATLALHDLPLLVEVKAYLAQGEKPNA